MKSQHVRCQPIVQPEEEIRARRLQHTLVVGALCERTGQTWLGVPNSEHRQLLVQRHTQLQPCEKLKVVFFFFFLFSLPFFVYVCEQRSSSRQKMHLAKKQASRSWTIRQTLVLHSSDCEGDKQWHQIHPAHAELERSGQTGDNALQHFSQ